MVNIRVLSKLTFNYYQRHFGRIDESSLACKENLVLLSSEDDVSGNAKQRCQLSDLRLGRV